MTHAALQAQLKDAAGDPDNIFRLVRSVAYFFQAPETRAEDALDLIIRLVDRRAEFDGALPGCGAMIDALSREAGLYPYIAGRGNWRDQAAVELMRAPGLEDVVFHIEQAAVFQRLASGQSIILSAPTSFGKSLLIDAFIRYKKPNTVVAVVPTIALLDEFRRRIESNFPEYDVITTSSDKPSGRKVIYIGTQERLLERDSIPDVDFFVIDEFYKLDLERKDARSLDLNAILARYGATAKQIYLLGPSIDDVPNVTNYRADLSFVRTHYSPVTADVIDRTAEGPSPEVLLRDLKSVRGHSSLIYMRSPKAAWTIAYDILSAGSFKTTEFCKELGAWLHTNFHPEWVLGNTVASGFGIHHGRIPRSIAHLVIDLFNRGELKAILCTSSMIEGVNTAAENVFIYDKHISINKLDRFTFDNIKGRAGRLFKHNVGKVFLYSAPPDQVRFEVNIPLFDGDEGLVPELLVQIDDERLSGPARRRKRGIADASLIPVELLKLWARFGVDALNRLAEDVADDSFLHDEELAWKGVPTYPQMEAVMGLVWNKLEFERHDIRSPSQFAYFARELRRSGSIRSFMDALVKERGKAAQIEIDRCMNFLRGAEYSFPQVLRAINDVVDAVHGAGIVDYRVFAQQLQNLFLPAGSRTLDEFGVPLPLIGRLDLQAIDEPRTALRKISDPQFAGRSKLTNFERRLLDLGIGAI